MVHGALPLHGLEQARFDPDIARPAVFAPAESSQIVSTNDLILFLSNDVTVTYENKSVISIKVKRVSNRALTGLALQYNRALLRRLNFDQRHQFSISTSSNMNDNFRAAGLLMLAMTMISSNDAIVKTASESMSVGQILFVRGMMACVILGTIIKLSGRPLVPRISLSRINLIRASLETAATLCFITGLSLLPIATASTLVWTSPLLLTLLAATLLKEQVVPARWIAVIVGFAGVLLVTQPFGGGFSLAMLLPLLAAFFVAARDVVTRRINRDLHSFYITLASLMLVTTTGFLISLFNWRPLEFSHVLMLAASAALLTGGFFSQVSAIRMGELSFIAPFSFIGIIVALILGYVFWGDVPTAAMLTGIALITASCVYIARTNNRQSAN